MEQDNNILCLVTFFRHGARNPGLILDRDLKFKRADGLITETGFKNTIKRGQSYRFKYLDFLKQPKNIKALCSDVARCKYTLYCRLKGMLNDDYEFDRNTNLEELLSYYSKIVSSIKVLPIEEDDYFQVLKQSSSRETIKKLDETGQYDVLKNELKSYLDRDPAIKEAYDKYNSYLNIQNPNNPLTSIHFLADYFSNGSKCEEVSQTEEFKFNAEKYKEIYKSVLDNNLEFYFLSLPIKEVRDYARILYSGFIKKLGEIFSSAISGEKESIFLFSGHDDNVMSILTAIGHDVKSSDRDFDTELTFELVQKNGKYKVNTILNGVHIENKIFSSTDYQEWKEIEDSLNSILKSDKIQ